MHHVDPALLTIAWATAAGLVAQVIGARWRIPAIVPLLVMGMLLGPSGVGVVQPVSLGGGLSVIVKLAVAVILFDGGMRTRIEHFRVALKPALGLATVGVHYDPARVRRNCTTLWSSVDRSRATAVRRR